MSVMNVSQVVITGPEAVKAMHRVNQVQDWRDAWPYPWLCPPLEAQPVFRVASVETDNNVAGTLILEYSVPSGLQFALCGLVQLFSGAGYIPGGPDIIWTLDVDTPIGGALQGYPLPGLFQVPVPLGGFLGPAPAVGGISAPWKFEKPFILKPNQVLRSKALTGGAISAGSPNFLISVFSGFTWPI